MAKNDLVRVIVAPGRCIQIPHPTQKLIKDPNGKPFIGPKLTLRPGDFYECTRDEAERLEKLGTVKLPGGQEAPKPMFGSSDTQDQVIGANGSE